MLQSCDIFLMTQQIACKHFFVDAVNTPKYIAGTVGIVRSRTKATEFRFLVDFFVDNMGACSFRDMQ
jgi:hypothetical protein